MKMPYLGVSADSESRDELWTFLPGNYDKYQEIDRLCTSKRKSDLISCGDGQEKSWTAAARLIRPELRNTPLLFFFGCVIWHSATCIFVYHLLVLKYQITLQMNFEIRTLLQTYSLWWRQLLEDDPIHVAIETSLLCVILYYLFFNASRKKGSRWVCLACCIVSFQDGCIRLHAWI